jgi:hypothetical protein
LVLLGCRPSRERWERRAERAEAWWEMEVELGKPFGPRSAEDERVWLWP